MAISNAVPPWLNINPKDFLAAAEAGARMGLSVASLRQQAGQAQANRDQQAAEFAAKMEQARWEQQEQMKLRSEILAEESARRRAQLDAQVQYQLANLGIRERTQKFREEQAAQSAANRANTERRLQQQADVASARESRLASLDPGTKMRGQSLLRQQEALKRMYLSPYTEEKDKPAIAAQIEDLGRQFDQFFPPKAAAAPETAAALPPLPGIGAAPSVFGQPTAEVPIPDLKGFGESAEAGFALPGASAPEAAPIAVPEPAAETPKAMTTQRTQSGWVTTPGGRRFRLLEPPAAEEADATAPRDEVPWPDEEEENDSE